MTDALVSLKDEEGSADHDPREPLSAVEFYRVFTARVDIQEIMRQWAKPSDDWSRVIDRETS